MKLSKCVLAYSGGLDTSAIVLWLVEMGYEVHCVLVDVGQAEDLPQLCAQAQNLGAKSAVVRDAKPALLSSVVPFAIGLGATYEGCYRLGTSLARPFIALEQVRRARELGGATLVHGATGKGNDQIRFEFAYRSLAPSYPVLAPWKSWSFAGREDLVNYLNEKGFPNAFALTKTFSLDENLWHLSIEGGPLEDPHHELDVADVLARFDDRFCGRNHSSLIANERSHVRIGFRDGIPVSVNGTVQPLEDILGTLNAAYRHAHWAWDLVIENRFTGIKSRGIYINPAAKVLHCAVDALARCCLNKVAYDEYVALGRRYGEAIYRGEYFSIQRVALEAAASALLAHLNGDVTVSTAGGLYASSIKAAHGLFTRSAATFDKSAFDHKLADGFIALSWLTSIGRPCDEFCHESNVESTNTAASLVRQDQSLPERGLVSAAP